MKGLVVTIDGPAGSGKTTVSRLLAKRLGAKVLESGSLYRAFTWILLKEGGLDSEGNFLFDPADKIREQLPFLKVDSSSEGVRVFFKGADISSELRLPEVDSKVSKVAAIPELRSIANELLREVARREERVIAEGRDMGTVVFPETPFKFFLTASARERARRRAEDWRRMGVEVSEEEILEKIKRRDEEDSTRKEAPLKVPEGAKVIDTTELSPEEVVEEILSELKRCR